MTLTVLVVLHHVALTYGNIPVWYHVEPAQDPSGLALDVLVMFDQAFFMGLFFLLSGFFTPGSHDRQGRPSRSSGTGWYARHPPARLPPAAAAAGHLRHLQADGPAVLAVLPRLLGPGPDVVRGVLLVLVAGYALVRRYGRALARAQGAPGLVG
ncbi:hypothetical protein [Nonomuraea dietziae]|uniref:hypothetical protein n=1 Tax=Nonomuraea dietziae TaxID=65515 RepID=UPI0031E2A9AB